MRYQEAYELVDASLLNAELSFPVLEATKQFIFDNKIQEIGQRVVRKTSSETFATTGVRAYTFTNLDVTTQVYKVELGKKNIPFIAEEATNVNIDNDDIDQIGYYLKDETIADGTITSVTAANPVTITSASHGLETGDVVFIDGVGGRIPAAGTKSDINDKRHRITYDGTNTFTIPVNGSGYTSYTADTGTWIQQGLRIYFTKDTDNGESLTVYYYAKPSSRNSVTDTIDLPDQLIPAAVHYTIGELLSYNGNLQRASGHNGLGLKLEQSYVSTNRSREAMPDVLRLPLQDFIKAR